jgi:hypothetical protein
MLFPQPFSGVSRMLKIPEGMLNESEITAHQNNFIKM